VSARSVDPRTGAEFGPQFADTTSAELESLVAAAARAAPSWAATSRRDRAALLARLADRLDAATDELVALADAETALGAARLTGELARTTFQLRMFASLLEDPAFLPAEVDTARVGAPPQGRPELRRVLVPLGPVAVFAASNFPFAFSVAGGDTASALAAGCPVIVKAHPGHPQLSVRVAAEICAALADRTVAPGVFGLVHGFGAGERLMADSRIRAAAFTGSREAGLALLHAATNRPDPIPFYGELGSVNPVFVTRAAARPAAELAEAYLDSLTAGAGQFCTNPSVLVVPRGTLLEPIAAKARERRAGHFLHGAIAQHYRERLGLLAALPGARMLVQPAETLEAGYVAPVAVVAMGAAEAVECDELFDVECFGPAGVVVEYDDDAQAVSIAQRVPGCLVATVHGSSDEPLAAELVAALWPVTGRVVWNGWPTGVAVSPAQHHGGPFPATTNARYTSVGSAAIERFLRPVAFQSVPDRLLPAVATAR
jgi:NADP-dependent aldehyde dehydrogenase